MKRDSSSFKWRHFAPDIILLINVNYIYPSHCLSIFVTDKGVVAS